MANVPRSPPFFALEQSLCTLANSANLVLKSLAARSVRSCVLRISIASLLERVMTGSFHELGLREPACLMSKCDAAITLGVARSPPPVAVALLDALPCVAALVGRVQLDVCVDSFQK